MREVRAANSGLEGWSSESSPLGQDLDVSDGRTIGGAKFRAPTHYAPRPAAAAPDPVDYSRADTAPRFGLQQTRRPDLSGTDIPVDQRHDHRTLHRILAAREAEDDLADMDSWDAQMARNSRQDQGAVLFAPVPRIERRTRAYGVNALGQSVPRPRWS
jgi:hypothetical protein